MKASNIQKRLDTINKLNADYYIVESSQYFTEGQRAKKLELIQAQVDNKQDELVRIFFFHGLNIKDFDFGSIDTDCFSGDIKEMQKKNLRDVEELNRLRAVNLV